MILSKDDNCLLNGELAKTRDGNNNNNNNNNNKNNNMDTNQQSSRLRQACTLYCKNESVYCTPFCPNAHTVLFLVCILLGQFSVKYTLSFL